MAHSPERSGRVLLVALALTAALPAAAQETASAPAYHQSFPDALERPWIGADFFANRYQDWRLAAGRVECLEAARREPMRTLSLLTAALSDRLEPFRASVRTGPLEPWSEGTRDSWSGLLIGAGGSHVDPRLSGLVHGRPGEDGGLVAAVDGTGRVTFRDNEHNVVGGSFTIAGPLHEEELHELPVSNREGAGFAGAPAFEVVLTLEGTPKGASYTLTLTARERGTERLLSRARLERVDPAQVDGALALVSHRGPSNSQLGHWFDDLALEGDKLDLAPERAFGPVLASLYTISGERLKLTAQMPPLGPGGAEEATLQILPRGEDGWRTVAAAALDQDAYTYRFVVDPWDPRAEVPYRVVVPDPDGGAEGGVATYEGLLRAEPGPDEPFVMAAFSGAKCFTGDLSWNHEGVWFPHSELTSAVAQHDPDLLFFAGDQVFDADLSAAQRAPLDEAVLDYLHRWSRWCWAFGELARQRPVVCLPDDADLYQAHLWGAGGRHAERADEGGYVMPPRFLEVVQRTQTSHHPDPVDPEPAAQGLSVHFTRLDWGGVSFALLEDRKFKSAPAEVVPHGNCVDGWFLADGFDTATESDAAEATLLGERQLAFLREWVRDWSYDTWMKVALSSSVFADLTTLPEGARNDEALLDSPIPGRADPLRDGALSADTSSSAWPQSGRARALLELRRGFAVHIGGDRNLGSVLRYGLEQWDDAGYAFALPAIANPWPRRWLPARAEGSSDDDVLGRHLDGFGNMASLHAVANPVQAGIQPAALYDRAPGYGIVRFDRSARTTTFECWPRWMDPKHPSAKPYEGFPIEVHQLDNRGPKPVAYLPTMLVSGAKEPVLRVIDEENGELVYSLRVQGDSFRPPVYGLGSYRLEIGEAGDAEFEVLEGVKAPAEVTFLRVEL